MMLIRIFITFFVALFALILNCYKEVDNLSLNKFSKNISFHEQYSVESDVFHCVHLKFKSVVKNTIRDNVSYKIKSRLLSSSRDKNLPKMRENSPLNQTKNTSNSTIRKLSVELNNYHLLWLYKFNQVKNQINSIRLRFLKLITLKHDFKTLSNNQISITFSK